MKTFQASPPKILGLEYSRRRNPTKMISIFSSPREDAHHDVLLSRLEVRVSNSNQSSQGLLQEFL
jgi:hypothetical protein